MSFDQDPFSKMSNQHEDTKSIAQDLKNILSAVPLFLGEIDDFQGMEDLKSVQSELALINLKKTEGYLLEKGGREEGDSYVEKVGEFLKSFIDTQKISELDLLIGQVQLQIDNFKNITTFDKEEVGSVISKIDNLIGEFNVKVSELY